MRYGIRIVLALVLCRSIFSQHHQAAAAASRSHLKNTRINSDRALLGGGSMSGTRTVPYGREDRRLLHVSFSQDVLPKPIYQLILSEDYNNRIIPFF